MKIRNISRAVVKRVIMLGRELGLINPPVAELWVLLLGLSDA